MDTAETCAFVFTATQDFQSTTGFVNSRSTINMATMASFREIELKTKVYNDFTDNYGTRDGLEIRKLLLNVDTRDSVNQVQKLSLGNPSPVCPTKVILLIGGSGHGKSTLINAMVNYLMGVDFNDDFRFLLKDECGTQISRQSDAQTQYITAYAFYLRGMPYDYNYILIDTPGYGHPSGIEKDKELLSQLKSFLSQDTGDNHINAVGMVTPASVTRLTDSQKYIFNGVSLMFGRDIEDIIYVMSTFADVEKPPLLATLRDANIHYKDFFKFNNSALYANNKLSNFGRESHDADDIISINRTYWEIGYRSLDHLFHKLGQTFPISLKLTKEVLEERQCLQRVLFELQSKIHVGLSKLTVLYQERDMLSRIKDDLQGCANYEEEVEVPKTETIYNTSDDDEGGHFDINFSPKDLLFRMNISLGKKSKKTTQFSLRWVKEKRTVKELLLRYKLSLTSAKDKELLINKMEADIENFTQDMTDLIKQAKNHVERLHEIALSPTNMSMEEYIDLLIQSEKMEKKHNFQKRIELLQMLKRGESDFFCLRGPLLGKSGFTL